jgi:thiamine-monophosphate kinase
MRERTFMGETGMIRNIQRIMPKPSSRTVIGIGDDAAAIRPTPGTCLLITTDSLIEQVHFDLAFSSYFQLGRKALAVNLSDIAAMGGTPRAFLVSLGLTERQSPQNITQLYRGMRKEGESLDLIGGNITCSTGPFSIGITLLGEAAPKEIVTRGGASVGDALYVTGTLGDAAAGLSILKSPSPPRLRIKGGGGFRRLIQRHQTPSPRVQEGRLLANIASAMIDLSDGLSSDLHHLATQSGVGAVLELSHLPASNALKRYALQAGTDPIEYILHGGEDYELLFSVPERKVSRLEQLIREGCLCATRIGTIVHRRLGIIGRNTEGKRQIIRPRGYDHLKISPAGT